MKNFRRMMYLKFARMGRGSNAPVPSIISFGTKIKGNVLGGDIIHIDGRLEGNICCDELVIGVKGVVLGQVRTKTLNLYGTLQGTAETEKLFIASTARLIGDSVHNSIAIEPGAYIEGRCLHIQSAAESGTKDKTAVAESAVKKTAENAAKIGETVKTAGVSRS